MANQAVSDTQVPAPPLCVAPRSPGQIVASEEAEPKHAETQVDEVSQPVSICSSTPQEMLEDRQMPSPSPPSPPAGPSPVTNQQPATPQSSESLSTATVVTPATLSGLANNTA